MPITPIKAKAWAVIVCQTGHVTIEDWQIVQPLNAVGQKRSRAPKNTMHNCVRKFNLPNNFIPFRPAPMTTAGKPADSDLY